MGRFPRPRTAGGRSNGPARWRRWPGQRSCRATRRARAYPRTPLAVIRLALYSTLRVTPITPIRVAPKKLPSPLSNRLNADSSRNSHALSLTWRPFAPYCGVLIRPYLEPARIGLLGSRRFPIQRPTRAALRCPLDLQRRGSAPTRRPHPPRSTGHTLVGGDFGDFGDFQGRPDLPDAGEHLDAQFARRCVMAAVLMHEAFHRILQAVFAQAWTALVEMLADLRARRLVGFAVEVGVDPLKYLSTGHLMRLSAAHVASLPGSWPSGDDSGPVAEAALTRPRSAA